MSIGEVVRNGERFELQLKGCGRTPFSRGFDGRAVLRSSIREYLASEAMHHMRVPTTRALSVITTGLTVRRPWYRASVDSMQAEAVNNAVKRGKFSPDVLVHEQVSSCFSFFLLLSHRGLSSCALFAFLVVSLTFYHVFTRSLTPSLTYTTH